METVLISLACFGQMCNEADIVQSSETLNVLQISQNLNVYNELSNEATKFTAGKYHLMVNSGLRDQFGPTVFVLLRIWLQEGVVSALDIWSNSLGPIPG